MNDLHPCKTSSHHNSLLEDRSYILFLFGSWHTVGPQDALVKLILSAETESGPAFEHPLSHTSELSLESFKRINGTCWESSRRNSTNGLDHLSYPFQPSCSMVQLERIRKRMDVRKRDLQNMSETVTTPPP